MDTHENTSLFFDNTPCCYLCKTLKDIHCVKDLSKQRGIREIVSKNFCCYYCIYDFAYGVLTDENIDEKIYIKDNLYCPVTTLVEDIFIPYPTIYNLLVKKIMIKYKLPHVIKELILIYCNININEYK